VARRSEWLIHKSQASSTDGMVTAMQPLAAEAGAEMLRRGGSAADAAIAAAYVLGVVEPCWSGIGGLAWMTYRDASSGALVALDGSPMLPDGLRPELFELSGADERSNFYGWRATKGDAQNTGWLAPSVPTMSAVLGEAHVRFGRLPWRDLLEPAIHLADDGVAVDHYLSLMLTAGTDRLALFPESRRVFLRPSGAPLVADLGFGPGDRLVQKDLARTLRIVADQGPRAIYGGEVGAAIVAEMARNGGVLAASDLESHATRVVEPADEAMWLGYRLVGSVHNTGFPTVIETLQILEGMHLEGRDPQSAAIVHLEIEALRRAFVDRLQFLGDADCVPVPYRGIVDPFYAAERRASIDPARATPGAQPGNPWPYDDRASPRLPQRAGGGTEGQTAHINVVDKDRNMVSLTSTLGGMFGSAVVVPGTGILLNNAAMWFDPLPGAVTSMAPRKRLLGAASSILVMLDDQPLVAMGSPGARRVISAVALSLLNLLQFKMPIQAAIEAPRVHSEGRAASVSARFPSSTLDGLRALGHELTVVDDNLGNHFFARPSGIVIDPTTGDMHAGVFQFSPATAVGL
jgi:gamma-glutamyltranspeptidase/glutathione hydrolase